MWVFAYDFRSGVGFDLELMAHEPMVFGDNPELQDSSGIIIRLPLFEMYIGKIYDES